MNDVEERHNKGMLLQAKALVSLLGFSAVKLPVHSLLHLSCSDFFGKIEGNLQDDN